jgi:hypothetical protein
MDTIFLPQRARRTQRGIPKILRYSFIDLFAVAAGGRHEETTSKYAVGIRKIGIRAEGSNGKFKSIY